MSNFSIAIIDYGVGNVYNVKKALDSLQVESILTSNKDEIENANAIILPGVGAFEVAMGNLRNLGLDIVLKEQFKQGKPILGICLGMQLMFDESHENGTHEGLGLIKGTVERFPSLNNSGGKNIIPQVQWNNIKINNRNESLLKKYDSKCMYFVHSYYCKPLEASEIIYTSSYGDITYASGVKKNNAIGFQFHPEKSSKNGINLLKDWLLIINKK